MARLKDIKEQIIAMLYTFGTNQRFLSRAAS